MLHAGNCTAPCMEDICWSCELAAAKKLKLTAHVHQRQRVHPAFVVCQRVAHRQQLAPRKQLKGDTPAGRMGGGHSRGGSGHSCHLQYKATGLSAHTPRQQHVHTPLLSHVSHPSEKTSAAPVTPALPDATSSGAT